MAVPADKTLTSLDLDAAPARVWPSALVLFGGCLLLVFSLFHETLLAMVSIWWRSDTYAHGMLIAPITLYMIVGRRQELATLTPRADLWGAAVLFALSCSWAVAAAAEVGVVQQLVLVLMIPALVWALLGRHVLWAAAFPLAYLLFAVPIGESLVEPLQDFTAVFTVKALRATGLPVFSEGRYITIPSGNFEVAEACSGIRYLIASVALGCLYAYLTYRAVWRRLAFVALAIVMPIIANGVRAYGIVMLAHLSDMKLATGVDHIIYGWFFFGLVVMLMFWIGRFWADETDSPVVAADARLFVPARSSRAVAGIAVAALAAAAFGPLLVMRLDAVQRDPVIAPFATPAAADSWTARAPAEWKTTYNGAAQELRADYARDGDLVQVYAAAYPARRNGARLVSSVNLLYEAKQWVHAGESTQVARVEGKPIEVREQRLISGERRRLIWYWYEIGPHHAVQMPVAKAWQAWEALTGGPRRDLVVALATPASENAEEARERLRTFLDANGAALRERLGGAR